MKVNISDKEYVIKSKQAVEILNLIEKSEIFAKMKGFKELFSGKDMTAAIDSLKVLPFSYNLAREVIAIATGLQEKGIITPNWELVDELEHMYVPMYAMSIFQSLISPIAYVITDDGLENEKKSTTNEVSIDPKSGTSESPSEVNPQS